jgi:ribosomal protein S14
MNPYFDKYDMASDSRNAVRELAHDCFLTGVTKASW